MNVRDSFEGKEKGKNVNNNNNKKQNLEPIL